MLPPLSVRADIGRAVLDELIRIPIWFRTQNILIVVDGGISLNASQGNFGIGRIAQLVDGADFGFALTRVVLATRDGAQIKHTLPEAQRLSGATYEGFRFDQLEPGGGRTIDLFDQVWCFGFKPGIHNATPADDAHINDAANAPTSPAETTALRDWMDHRMGGVLAMGDHSILGASMCNAIPRVRRMRRWTAAEGVPMQVGPQRYDTLQPGNAAETYNPVTNPYPSAIAFDNQSDAVPQPIEWVPESSFVVGLRVVQRPHPILCHPTLGPIDVLPDHMHEGACIDTAAITDPTGDFPTVGGQHPMPKTIAYGRTLPDPPWNHAFGAQPGRRFPLVNVYDGQSIGLGRVVVDSTWHHWFDINLTGLETAGGDHWEKVKRYYVNVAIWLAKPAWRARMWWPYFVALPFTYAYVQQLDRSLSLQALGREFIGYLRPLGPCWVSHWIFDIFHDVPKLIDVLRHRWPEPNPCLTCPPWPFIEETIYGRIAQVALDHADRVHAAIAKEGRVSAKLFDVERVQQTVREAGIAAIRDVVVEYRASLGHTEKLLAELERAAG